MSVATVAEPLLVLEGLSKQFSAPSGRGGRGKRTVRAVDDVSFSIRPGETLGLVGESGCGKSTVARLITRLLEPTSGRIVFQGQDISRMGDRDLRPIRPHIQMIFQDPLGSLDPRMRVGDIVGEPLVVHRRVPTRAALRHRVAELLDQCGMPADAAGRHPQAFSGGQQQRIGIARALALNPQMIVCDEAVSALDVSVQAQVINLLEDLQRRLNLSYLFISHDLGVVRHISHRIAVMYLGRIVEVGEAEQVCNEPRHPYTASLLSAAPNLDGDNPEDRILLPGEIGSNLDPPSGCPFHPRCPRAAAIGKGTVPAECATHQPPLHAIDNGTRAACWYPLPTDGTFTERMTSPPLAPPPVEQPTMERN